jgi:O-antigen/teichoic acid export membrane protein
LNSEEKSIDTLVVKRLLKGFGVNTYQQILIIIIQLVGVPVILHYWGAQLYGEWLILSAIPSYLSMADLGFSMSAGNDMTAKMARDDKRGVLAVFQSLTIFLGVIIIFGLLLSSLIFPFLPINRFMHLTLIDESNARWILWMLAASVLIQQFDGLNDAGFRSQGEYAFHQFFYATSLFIQQGFVWIIAILGYQPFFAALSMLIIRTIYTILMTILLLHRQKIFKLGNQYLDKSIIVSLIKPAIANMAIPLAQALNIQGMVLVIGAVLNPLAVVTFSTLRTLTRFAYQIVLSICIAFEPEMAREWGKQDKEMLLKLYLDNLRLSFWLALMCIFSLFFFGDTIIKLWTHNEVSMDRLLYIWLLLSAFASVLWYGGLNLMKSGNRHLQGSLIYVIASSIALIISYFSMNFTKQIHFAGLSLLVMDTIMISYIFTNSSKILEIPGKKVIFSIINTRPLILRLKSLLHQKQTLL